MVKFLSLLLVLLISTCQHFNNANYFEILTNDVTSIVDSLDHNYSLNIPDTTYWLHYNYNIGDSLHYNVKTFYKEDKRKTFILTLSHFTNDTIYKIKLRIE